MFQEVSQDQMRIAKGDNWRTFILFGFGAKLEKNCRHAPVTAALLEKVPNLQTAWFSILEPGYLTPIQALFHELGRDVRLRLA